MYMKFTVKCYHCGHKNRPNPSPKVGILNVLTGEFDTCRKCKTKFKHIIAPKRPLVMECISNGISIKDNVILKEYKNQVPKSLGI